MYDTFLLLTYSDKETKKRCVAECDNMREVLDKVAKLSASGASMFELYKAELKQ